MSLLTIFVSVPISADSDGYFWTGTGLIVYEMWLEDDMHIYILPFGQNNDFSEIIKFQLPIKIKSNIYSIEIEENIIKLVLRDATYGQNERGEFGLIKDDLIFITIGISKTNEPNLIEVNRIANSKDIKVVPYKGNLGLWSRNGNTKLKSIDKLHSYELIFNVDELSREKVSEYSGIINHEHTTTIVKKDKKGKVLNQKVLFSGVFQETID
jgi:hypothetical protein